MNANEGAHENGEANANAAPAGSFDNDSEVMSISNVKMPDSPFFYFYQGTSLVYNSIEIINI